MIPKSEVNETSSTLGPIVTLIGISLGETTSALKLSVRLCSALPQQDQDFK